MMNKNKRSGRPWLPISVIAAMVMAIPLTPIAAGRVAADPLLAAPPESAMRLIVIDPGHGGHDKGVESPEGAMEKRVAFALADALKAQLAGSGCRVMMTRTGDYGLEIRERSSLANHHDADLFISLHAGASSRRAVNRWTIYYDSAGESDETHLQQQIPLFEWDRLQQRHVKSAVKLAAHLKNRVAADLADQEVDIVPAPLAVLRGVDLPAVLIETGYLTHPATAREMTQDAEVRRAARAIAGGIADYLENN